MREAFASNLSSGILISLVWESATNSLKPNRQIPAHCSDLGKGPTLCPELSSLVVQSALQKDGPDPRISALSPLSPALSLLFLLSAIGLLSPYLVFMLWRVFDAVAFCPTCCCSLAGSAAIRCSTRIVHQCPWMKRPVVIDEAFFHAQYDWTTGVPDNGNYWRKFRVPPLHPLRSLVLYMFYRGGNSRAFRLPGAGGDHFHCTVEPSRGHI